MFIRRAAHGCMAAVNWQVSNRSTCSCGGREIHLPEMRRSHVRTRGKGAHPDELYKNHPPGSVLLWGADTPPDMCRAAVSVDERTPAHRSCHLLYCRQRLISTAAAPAGSPGRYVPAESPRMQIEMCFNMNHPDNPAGPDTGGEWRPPRGRRGRWGDGVSTNTPCSDRSRVCQSRGRRPNTAEGMSNLLNVPVRGWRS